MAQDPIMNTLSLRQARAPAISARWERVAPGLKTIEDARAIRARLLVRFEESERRRLMTIEVIGGGPTGVEMAGAIAELSRYTLARDFRHIKPTSTRILLVEGADRVLGAFAEPLSDFAAAGWSGSASP
jgi:NADH:ubiquinone reductase (H+-translocating)